MKLYKSTDENDQTYRTCQWGENVTVETDGEGGVLYGAGFTYWYTHPLLAVLHHPLCGPFAPNTIYEQNTMHLWEGEGNGAILKRGPEVQCTKATTVRRIKVPQITDEQRITFVILCAMELCDEPTWREGANKWLSGEDRSETSAARLEGWASSAGAWAGAWAAWTGTDLAGPVTVAFRVAHAMDHMVTLAFASGKTLNLVGNARRAIKEEKGTKDGTSAGDRQG